MHVLGRLGVQTAPTTDVTTLGRQAAHSIRQFSRPFWLWMARLGLGGAVAGGGQYVSWIHADDLCRAIDLLVDRDDLDGAVNLAAPEPLPQRDFMRDLRRAWGGRPGLPATRAMAAVGAWALRTDTELLLKSRRVVPGRLLDAAFEFAYPSWPDAAADLVAAVRARSRS